MTPQEFLKEFGSIANAPSGVKRLREMILQLAVMGKLVEQDLRDEPARELLKRIDAKSIQLSTRKEIRTPIKPDEAYLTLPENWEWVRLKWIGNLFNGNSINEKIKEEKYIGKKDGLPFIATKDVEYGFTNLNYENGVKIPLNESKFKIAHRNSVFICAEGGSAGKKCGITDRDVYFGNKLFAFESYGATHEKFVLSLYLTPIFYRQFQGKMTGIIGGISLANFAEIPFPLPPLEEQHRIVAKVDQLMALCDTLEAQQKKRSDLVSHTRKAALDALANVTGGKELQTSWQRVEENLASLFENPEDVEDLKKSILQNAVMGKLVEQNPKEGSGNILLKLIKEKRNKILKNGYPNREEAHTQQKKQREQKVPMENFQIPSNWACATLMQASLLVVDCHNKTAPYSTEGIRLLRTTNIRNGQINFKEPKFVTEKTYKRWSSRCPPEPGDILITREAPMGEACIIPEGMQICMGQRMMLVRIVPETMDLKYLLFTILDPHMMDRVQDKPIGATVKHLRVGGVETLMIPIPPLAEQHRIVAKTQSLLVLCDTLQSQLSKSRTIAENLAQSVLESITGITTEKQEKMKIPKTELVSKLVLVKKPGTKDNAPLSVLLANHKNELSAKALWSNSGLPIDEFYRQLKIEMIAGWIEEPEKAEVRILEE